MRTSTKEAFSLFESWASEAQSLFVVGPLKEGLEVGTKFKAVISKVSSSEESIILRAENARWSRRYSHPVVGCCI